MGVKLHTVHPNHKGASRAPILLTRNPYDANGLTSHAESAILDRSSPAMTMLPCIVEGGYIRVVQEFAASTLRR